MQWFYLIWSLLGGLCLLRLSYLQLRFSRDLRLLSRVEPSLPSAWPRVSLIIPACNEEATIAPALMSLLDMDYPQLEIIVINDRSTDQTHRVVQEIQSKTANVKLVDIELLPEGWLGKVHAMDCGVRQATGEWLLFSDADIHYGPQSLKKAISWALTQGLDHLTVAPAVQAQGFWLRAHIIQFTQVLTWSLNFRHLENPQYRQAMGIGAFNLVRKSLYDRTPGFEWLRLEVIDDIGLASMVKESGGKTSLLGGLGEIAVEWYPSFWELVRGLEKNTFSVFQYSSLAVILNALVGWFFFLALFWAPWRTGSELSLLLIAGVLVIYYLTAIQALKKLIPFSLAPLLLAPLAQAFFPFITLRAMGLFHWRGGIHWRGTFYRRESLVKHQRLRFLDQIFFRKFPKKKH